ncbi:MAG: SAP domain-containing protein [Blastomonas sp.]
MAKLRNTSGGPRGAYLKNGSLVIFEHGQVEEGDFSNFDADAFEVEGDADEGLDNMTVADLKALAEAEGIDLGDATKKADIISAIELGRE